MSTLSEARYGKDLVRVFRIVRRGDGTGIHDVAEYNVRALVEGDIAASFTEADNSVVVATDSIKNIVYYVAKISPHVLSPELFALHIGAFLLSKYAHLTRAFVDVEQLKWSRIRVGANEDAHKHSFQRDGEEKRIANVRLTKSKGGLETDVTAGLVDMLLLKSSGSSFSGFIRDEFTTLASVDDRIFSTAVDMSYIFPTFMLSGVDGISALQEQWGFEDAAREARRVTLEIFAEDESASVQATLFKMGKQLLKNHSKISSVLYVLPNKHYVAVNMSYLGIENVHESEAEVFVPLAAPSGRITATVSRP